MATARDVRVTLQFTEWTAGAVPWDALGEAIFELVHAHGEELPGKDWSLDTWEIVHGVD